MKCTWRVSCRQTGRASDDQNHVRKSTDFPGAPEFSEEGPASGLRERPDAMEAEIGPASSDQKRVRKSADLPGTPEFSEEGPESDLREKPDSIEAETGPASND